MVPRCRSNGFMSIVVLIVFQISVVSCIDMCSNKTETGSTVFFARIDDGMMNCHCSVSATNGSKIIFNTKNKTPSGCTIKLAVIYSSITTYYSCESTEEIFHTIIYDEKIDLRLEPVTSVTNKFEFGFNIESHPTGSLFTISCYSLPNPPTTPKSTLTTSQTDTSSQSTTTTESTDALLQTTTALQSTDDILTSAPHTSLTTQYPPELPIISTIAQSPTANYSLYLVPGIVGGMIGTTVVIVVFVIITLCVLKIRKYKSKSTSPTQVSDPDYLEIVS